MFYKYKKSTICPGSAIAATSFINDSDFSHWMALWFQSILNLVNPNNSLIIGISSSGNSKDIAELFDYIKNKGFYTALITAKTSQIIKSDIEICTGCSTYHASELVALGLGYQLVHGFGYICPNIK